MPAPIIPQPLRDLEAAYKAAGHDLWLVGGCVRDRILGLPAKDVDLTTTATPDEQIEICEASGFKWFGTGLQHGTLTIIAGEEPYEITTLRTDVETDGRHATVAYTRELEIDLERRDLTMNAIAMTLDGHITDPFGGVEDALAGRIRFVGDPALRIREDYLRILRWFRFLGRFSTSFDPSSSDVAAIRDNSSGLSQISVERIWSEFSKILAGPNPAGIIDLMHKTRVLDVLEVQRGNLERLSTMREHTSDPAALLAGWLVERGRDLAKRWKMSNAEREQVDFFALRFQTNYRPSGAKLDLVNGYDPKWVDTLLRVVGMSDDANNLQDWEIPVFPIQGRDLVATGMKPGKAVGLALAHKRSAWIASDYSLSREALLEA